MSQTATATASQPPLPASREAALEPSRATARYRRRVLRPVLMLGGVLVVAIVSLTYWVNGGRYVSIDNAYVRAAKLAVATDVSGIVQEVDVKEGEPVQKGQLLFRLDPRPFQIALDGAQANLAQVELSLNAMKRDYQRMLRDVQAKQAQVQADQAAFDRYASLVKGGSVTRSDYDDARFKLASNKAAVEGLQEQAQVQLAKLGGNADGDPTKMPQYMEAKARVDEAQRQLDHTVVKAPFAGVVTQVEQIQPGQYLAAATAAFGLVSTERVWVEASPKETELTYVKPGASVEVTVDTYPGRTWKGDVQSIAPNSGSEFSVLPAQNASGNWVKVVQRIPLRVQLVRHPGDPDLRAGMSVEVNIDTGHVRHLSDLFGG